MVVTTKMTSSHKNIKIKIALHSFGLIIFLFILFILSISFATIQMLPYSIAGLITAETLRIIFSKKKYISSIHQKDLSISINYFNRLLIKKNIEIDKENLKITDVTETN